MPARVLRPNDEIIKFSKLFPGAGYTADKVVKKDKFIDPYMGKIYNDGATELLSMGLEMLYRNPTKLAREDPELFNLILKIINGLL